MPSPTAPSDPRRVGDDDDVTHPRAPLTASRHWADVLFGPAIARPRHPVPSYAATAGLVLVGALLVLNRLPVDQWNLLWAEDGRVFLQSAYRAGPLENAFTGYAGYMHLVPRVLAELVAAASPIGVSGLWMNIAGAAVWAGMAAVVFAFLRDRLPLALRILMWAIVVFIPIGSQEAATNVANSHWFLTVGLFVVLSARIGTPTRAVVAAIVVFSAVASDPLTLLFTPLVIARAAGLRSWRENVPGIAFVVAAALQVWVILHSVRNTSTLIEPLGLLRAYLIRVVWGSFTGDTSGNDLYHAWGGRAILVVAACILLAMLALMVIRRRRSAPAALALLTSVGYFGVVGAMTWVQVMNTPSLDEVTRGSRYLIVPVLLFLLAVVMVVAVWLPVRAAAGSRPRVSPWIATALIASVLATPAVLDYQTPGYKANNPDNQAAVSAAERRCEETPGLAYDKVEIAPSGWSMEVSCALLEDR